MIMAEVEHALRVSEGSPVWYDYTCIAGQFDIKLWT